MNDIYVLGIAILPRNDLGENTREIRFSTTHPVHGSVMQFMAVDGDISLQRFHEIVGDLIGLRMEKAL